MSEGTIGGSYAEAFASVRQARPCVRPNDGFVRQLRRYEGQLKRRLKGDTHFLLAKE